MVKKIQLLLVVAMALVPWAIGAQTLEDYTYSTGVDASKWITITDSTNLLGSGNADGRASSLQDIGFNFPFAEDVYTQFSVNSDGNLRLGSTVTGSSNYSTPFNSTNSNTNSPKINFLGCDGYFLDTIHYVYAENTVDANNNSFLCVEFCLGTYTSATRAQKYKWQVHLYPNGNIQVVMAPTAPTTAPATSNQKGLCVNSGDGWIIDSDNIATHFSAGSTITWPSGTWPAPNTYYSFTRPHITLCPKPTSISASNITPTTATISFTLPDSVTTWFSTIYPDLMGTNTFNLSDTILNLSMLTPNTQYSVSVRTLCSEGDTSYPRRITFRTLCNALDSLPYTQDFESEPTGSNINPDFVNCWHRLNNGTQYFGHPYVSSNSNYNHTPNGTKGLYWYNNTTQGTYGDYQIAVLPGVDTNNYPVNTLQLTFWARSSNTSYYPTFTVGVMSNPNDINTFVAVDTINIGNSTVWGEYITSLESYTGNGAFVALRADRSASNWYAYVDDFTLEVIPTCPHVQNIIVHSITTNLAELSWTEAGSATNWEVKYLPVGETPDNSITLTVSDTHALLTGLHANTQYTVWVTPACSGYASTNHMLFRTNCNALDSLPYTQDFESEPTGSTTNPEFVNCWHRLNNGTTYFGIPCVSSNSNYNHTPNGTKGLYWYNSITTGTYGDYQIVLLPVVDTNIYPVNTLQLTFWARSSSTNYHPTFTIGVMSDPNDINTFVAMDTINIGNSTVWDEYITSLESYTGNGAFVALRADRPASNWYAYVDDFTLEVIPDCGKPNKVMVDNITSSSATISWTPSRSTQNNFILAYGTGTNPDSMTSLSITGTSTTLTGLSDVTCYNVYVKAVCGTNKVSECSRICSFSTTTIPYYITQNNPYYEDFENTPKWQLSNANTNKWAIGNAINNGGSDALYISNDNGLSNTYTISGSGNQWSYAIKSFAFPAGEVAISFDWKAYGENNYDYLRAFLVPDTVILTGGVSPNGQMPNNFRNTTPEGWIALDGGSRLNLNNNWQTREEYISFPNAGVYNLMFVWANDNGGGTQPPAAIDNINIHVLNCSAVVDLVVEVQHPNSATLSWTPIGDSYQGTLIEYKETYSDGDWDTIIVNGTTHATITGLNVMTDYDVRVTAICYDDYSRTISTSFNTFNCIYSLPYTDDFDSYTASTTAKTGVEPTCWTLVHQDVPMTDEYKPMIYYNPANAHSGDYSLILNKRGIYAMPYIDDGVNQGTIINDLKLSFYLKQQQTKYQLQVGVMSDLNDPNTFEPFTTIDNNSTDVEFVEVDFSSYTGDGWGKYIAFRNILAPGYNGDFSCNYIDDIMLYSCPQPFIEYITADNSFTWHDSTYTESGIYTYDNFIDSIIYSCLVTDTLFLTIYNCPNGISDTVTAMDSYTWHDQTYTKSGIYIFDYVYYENNIYSIWNIPADATYYCPITDTLYLTICNIHVADLPYTDDFETYTTSTTAKTGIRPPCWTLARQDVAIADEYKPMIYYNADNAHSGDYSLILNKRGIFAMPYIDTNISDLKMSFYLRQQQAKYQLQVGVMSDLYDFSTYIPLTTINNSSTDVEFVRIDFSSYTGNGHYIAFRNILAPGYNGDYSCNYIDDLTLYTCPTGIYYDTQVLGSYTWHDSTYTESGTHIINYENRYGCPITDTLHLTVCPALSSTAQYSDATVFVQGLNVPHDMCFDTLGNIYVVNHGYNGAYDSLQYTIACIDTSGNIRIVGTNLVYASGMVIDKEQSLYVNQGNGASDITKIPYGESQYVWTTLDILSNTLALFDDGNPNHFRLYAAASWGGGLRVIDHDGNYSSFGNFNRAFILGLSEDGEYLYFDTWNDNEETSTIYRYSYSEDTFTPMSGSIFRGVGEWGGIGSDNKCYFTAYSLSNPDYKALYRIDGVDSFTEIISDLPSNSEVRAPLWKQNGNTYDLYLGEVVNSNRPNPDDNRIIKFVSLGTYYDWKDTMNVTVCGETEYTWPVNGMTYTENGSYYYHTQTLDGCDSMVILNLIFAGVNTSETIVAERQYSWHDTTYTESGIYTFSYENEFGCSVTDTLFLTIYNCPKGISDTVTATDSYTWHNQSYTESGVYLFDYVYYEDNIYSIWNIPADATYYCPVTDTLYLTICNNLVADLPYSDDFDSYTSSTTAKTGVEPNCWTLVHQDVAMADEYKPMIYYNSDNAHSGDYSLLLNKRGIYAMPIIDTNISDIKLSFYLKQQQTKYRLLVGVIDNLEDPNTFVPVTTIDNSSTNVEYIEVDFSSYTGDGHYIAFRNILAPGYNGDFSCNYIDDLTLSVNYTVTTEVYPANGGMVTGGGIYPAGYTCTMTATAADGYNFLYWTDGSNIVSNQDVYNFTVSSNITLTAVFYVIGSQNHYCPGLKNPMSFTSGATSGAYVGFYSGQTGQKQWQAPDALTGATGVSMFSGIIPANQLANTTGNGGTSYCGNTLDPTKRFRIMSNTDGPGTVLQAGKDPLVDYNLSYCPTAFDPTITKSIRLGNCGYNAEAEALYYTIEVRPFNTLLFIYYALVVQSPGHGIEGDPSFVVRVTRRNALNQWQQISDTLFYTVSSYNISDGIDGWHRDGHGYGYVYYHDWDKINIDLSKYLYEQVRIEFYMSDCSASGHYGYCYIAGDCQPMEISIDGCHSGNTQEVATLSAPAGLTNYVWYKCNADGQFISNPYFIPDTVAFTQLTPDSNTNNTYTCTLDDFMVTDGENAGQLTNNMVFRCDITSALDPDKPIVTTHYARVINTKPVMAIDSIQSCGGNITLTNRSYVPHETDGCDTTATQWWFYHNGRVDTATGASTSYQFDNSGVYNIKVRSFSRDDHSCYADSTYTVNIIHNTGTFTSITVNTTTPYTWHNQTYDATGTYTFDYTDSNGCPSTDTLHLTIQNDCGIQVSDLPYTDNFDHYTASTTAKTGVEPDCWTLVHQDVAMTDEYKPMVYYNSSNAHSGRYALLLNKRCIYAMPAYEGDVSSLQLQFYLKQTQSKYQLQVGVVSDINDYTTFVPVATFNNTSTTASVLRTIDFASYTGDGHYIAFRNILASGYNGDYSCNYIDDITLTANSPVCSIGLLDLPYTDNFDHYTTSTTAKTGVEPPCWTLAYQNVSMTDEYKPMIYYSASNAHSGRYSLILNKRGIYAMPEFEGNVNTLQLSFYLKQTQSKYQLQVGVMSDLSDPSSFIPVATINNSSTTASVLNTVNFSSYTGNGHYIVFKNILASGYTGEFSCNYIDDLVLEIRQDPCVLGVSDLPYTDNFDSYTSSTTAKTGVEPPCWTLAYQNVSMTDEYKPMIYYSASNAHSGRYSLILNKRGIYAMPEFEGNVNTLQLSFYLKQTQSKYQLQVGVMSDLSDPSSFIPVTTINNSSTTASVLNTVNFSSYTGNGHYIVFKNILAPGNTGDFSCNYIDDLTLSVAGAKSNQPDNTYAVPENHNLALYPNPTTGIITVEADEEVVRVEVFDYTGRNVAVFESQTTLDLSRLAAGIYTLRVTLPERIEVRRVVKQ